MRSYLLNIKVLVIVVLVGTACSFPKKEIRHANNAMVFFEDSIFGCYDLPEIHIQVNPLGMDLTLDDTFMIEELVYPDTICTVLKTHDYNFIITSVHDKKYNTIIMSDGYLVDEFTMYKNQLHYDTVYKKSTR
jgi:hypothetical protein